MQLFVKLTMFNVTEKDEDVVASRRAFSKAWNTLLDSGKVIGGGIFADSRGGFLVVDVEKAEDFWSLPGPGILNHISMETHPVTPADRLFEMSRQIAS